MTTTTTDFPARAQALRELECIGASPAFTDARAAAYDRLAAAETAAREHNPADRWEHTDAAWVATALARVERATGVEEAGPGLLSHMDTISLHPYYRRRVLAVLRAMAATAITPDLLDALAEALHVAGDGMSTEALAVLTRLPVVYAAGASQ